MLKGLSISPGFALGRVHCLSNFHLDSIETNRVEKSEVNTEIDKFKAALQLSRKEVEQLLKLPQIKDSREIFNIFQAHLALIDDPDLSVEVIKRIQELCLDARSTVAEVIKDYSNFFKNLPDPQFQSKAIDIFDVGKRILLNCEKRRSRVTDKKNKKEGLIIFAEDLTPSEIISFDPSNIYGLAIEQGTPTSHACIMARSMGIPTLIQVKNLIKTARNNSYAIIDGAKGTIILDPDNELKCKYSSELKRFNDRQNAISAELSAPSITSDGVEISLLANIGQASDTDTAIAKKAMGIGLYRTEFAYITQKTYPTEKQLFKLYQSVVKKMGNSEVIIRTIDIGGDKIAPLVSNNIERNPDLGWRAIRMSLDNEDIFRTQLRAILRATAESPLDKANILFPMISNVSELTKAKNFLFKIVQDLKQENLPVPSQIKVGIMIEIPSAAIIADKFAPLVDFFSIGSNDLVQYTLAVDRTNSKISHLYQPANPAVISLIKNVVDVSEKYGRDLSICGEMAGDTRYTLLLLGLGIKKLSMNSVLLPSVKKAIRSISFQKSKQLVKPLLELSTAEEIENELSIINKELGLQ